MAYSIPSVGIELFTPKYSRQLLAGQLNNRALHQSFVDAIARDIINGRWYGVELGDPIAITTVPERLCNGQHRLEGIVKSGLAVRLWVARGVDPELMPYFDGGIARTHTEHMKFRHGNFTSRHGAALRWLCKQSGLHAKLTLGEDLFLYERYKDATDFAEEITTGKDRTLTMGSIGAVYLRAFYHEDLDRIRRFAKLMVEGVSSEGFDEFDIIPRICATEVLGCKEKSPTKKLITSKGTEKTVSITKQNYAYGVVEYCLRAYCRKKMIKYAKPAVKEQYPLPKGLELSSNVDLLSKQCVESSEAILQL